LGLLASISKHQLKFKQAAKTSRGAYTHRTIYLLKIHNANNPSIVGTGECAPLQGLSIDDVEDYEIQLYKLVKQINNNKADNFNFSKFPSIKFGLETALLDLKNRGKKIIFQNLYAIGRMGLPINGLIWMNDFEKMKTEAQEKIEKGFECIKIKVGAIDFKKECQLLEFIRKQNGGENLILRLDANGAFKPKEALKKIETLSEFNIHSIEQPIKTKQWDLMAELCLNSPIPIALDEELIGIHEESDMIQLLDHIKPKYLVFKPNLLGGFVQTDLWIKHAEERKIAWWLTSALESNIGLNAIAQYAANFSHQLHSGLGTGQLYTSNFTPFTNIKHGYLWRDLGNVSSDNLQAPTQPKL
jgi:o-succinylbenzoate synthase